MRETWGETGGDKDAMAKSRRWCLSLSLISRPVSLSLRFSATAMPLGFDKAVASISRKSGVEERGGGRFFSIFSMHLKLQCKLQCCCIERKSFLASAWLRRPKVAGSACSYLVRVHVGRCWWGEKTGKEERRRLRERKRLFRRKQEAVFFVQV